MIDSNDRARIDEARQELHRIILDREMKEALLLVFANKQDIPGAMTPTEVTEKLRLGQLKERMWYVVPSCATTGEGLFEGLVSLYFYFLLWDVSQWKNTFANCYGWCRAGSRITSKRSRRIRADRSCLMPFWRVVTQLSDLPLGWGNAKVVLCCVISSCVALLPKVSILAWRFR